MTMEQKFDALAAFVLAEDAVSRETARKALNAAMRSSTDSTLPPFTDLEDMIHQLLMEIGAMPHLVGYKYCVYGILQAVQKTEVVDSMTAGFYPMVAMKFDTTAARAERAIRHVIETAWVTGDPDKLNSFFGFNISAKNGKPTNASFIARCALVIRSRLRK